VSIAREERDVVQTCGEILRYSKRELRKSRWSTNRQANDERVCFATRWATLLYLRWVKWNDEA
ncbi:unnamed protein product, partial [Linum tenue]